MAGYTPLYSSIVTSSIWNEDDKTRIVWVTMLALADATGKVEGSVSGLAPVARVSLESCKKAIDRLKQPDRYSRTKEYEGRRIEEIEEGWQILNYEKFREKAKKRTAEYYRNYRLKQQTQTHTQTHTQTGATGCNTNPVAQRLQKQPVFDVFWKIYPKKVGKGAARKSWKKLKPSKELQQKILSAVEQQKKSIQWQKNDGQFVPNPATWLNQCRWDDTLPQKESNSEQMERIHKELLKNGKIKE